MRIRVRDLAAIGATIVVALTLVALMLPVASSAAGSLMTLVDPVTNAKARIENGRLRVGDGSGPLTVDGVVKDHLRSGTPLDAVVDGAWTGGALNTVTAYTVPANKRLIITHVSFRVGVPVAEDLIWVAIAGTDGSTMFQYLDVARETPYGARDEFTGSQDVALVFPAGAQVELQGFKSGAAASTGGNGLQITGVLVPA